MKVLILIIFFIAMIESREDFIVHFVNKSSGRQDLSIICTEFSGYSTFSVVPRISDISVIVKATLIEQINATGWGHLLVESSPHYPDELQAYLSGVIEGIITRPLIAAHWSNTYEGYCSESNTYCKDLYEYLKTNFISIVKKTRNSSGFLKMIRLQYWQMKGLQDGYDNNWMNDSRKLNEAYLLTMKYQLFKLYLLQVDCELPALSNILGSVRYHNIFTVAKSVDNDRCSTLIKYVRGSIFSAHVTWSKYNYMLRLTKLYDFPYKISDEITSIIISARKVSFSSYPGLLSSSDDFYITSAGLVTLETTINNANKSLWKPLKNMAPEIVFEYARVQAANRIASSGKEWISLFAANNSGTYNNQWMIVNNNVLKDHKDGERIPDGTLYIAEQLPGLIISADVTQHLRTKTYWASYNLPYDKAIRKMGNFQSKVDEHGDFYDYDKSPRALMFKRNASSVVDYETLMRFMRYNDFKNDPLSKCNCTPPFSAYNAISARNDLNPESGIYPFGSLGYGLYGGTDLKFTTSTLSLNMTFIGICGPTYDQQPVFDWSNVEDNTQRHNMHPQRFQFPPIQTPFT